MFVGTYIVFYDTFHLKLIVVICIKKKTKNKEMRINV